MNSFTGHALCQAMLLEDVSSRAEAQIEAHLRMLWERNGPDFVLDRLKALKEDTINSLVNPNYRLPPQPFGGGQTIAWNRRDNRPKGPLGHLYQRFPKPIDRIRVIGACIQAIEYEEATPKQVERFCKNVRSASRATRGLKLPDATLRKLETRLVQRVRDVTKPFGHVDLTNNAMPFSHVSVQTRELKQTVMAATYARPLRSSPHVHKAILELDCIMKGQFYSAPRICKSEWNAVLDLAYPDGNIPNGVRFPRKVSPRPLQARDYEVKRSPTGELLSIDCAEYSAKGAADYLGRLDFLQQRGGKLRSVANVNRYVNYTMEPFAKALEDVFYVYKQCAVLDQKEGLQWIQKKLREGTRITSLDLEAATDLLDFRVFTNALARDFPGSNGILARYARYFEKLAELPLWCEALDSPVQFRTGQPLGMKGSFQVLTAMNLMAGLLACKGVDLDPTDSFRVVGDDFVCDSRIASEYSKRIESWAGKTNHEKAMESGEFGEFLSHIVSKSSVYITKPKYRPSSKYVEWPNLEKARARTYRKIYRLTDSEQDALCILCKYSVDDMDYRGNLPRLRSKARELDVYDLEVMSEALKLTAEYRAQRPVDFEVSEMALEYMYLESPEMISDKYAPVVDGERMAKGPELHESIATIPTVIDRYDHKIGRTKQLQPKRKQRQSQETLAEDLSKLDAALNTGSSPEISLPYGDKASADDILLSAMETVAQGFVPTRQEATRVRSSLELRKERLLKEDQRQSRDLDDFELEF